MTDSLPDVSVAANPAVWIEGPRPADNDEERRRWFAEATAASARNFDLAALRKRKRKRYVALLENILAAFGSWVPDAAALTYLRMRHIGDQAIPVSVELYLPDEVEQISATGRQDDDSFDFAEFNLQVGAAPVVGESSRETVDDSEWERLLYFVEDDGELSSRVTYARTFPSTGVVAILRFGGQTPDQVGDILADVDDLARSIRVGGVR